ncbi:unnamed protein product [Symbiodinium sp. CCMP2592]|nr:unnamed protein product [Symbiodinium sp. CCMP2592]
MDLQNGTQPLDVEALSRAIHYGTIFLQSRVEISFAVIVILSWLFWVTMSICKGNRRGGLELTRLLQMVGNLEAKLDQIPSASLPGSSQGDNASLEVALQCVDAKIMEVQKECSQLRQYFQGIQEDETLGKILESSRSASSSSNEAKSMFEEWQKQVPPKIKEIHGFTSGLGQLSRAVQVMGVDTQKQFALHETLLDGLLKQGRESLHHIQGEERAQSDKLGKLDITADELKAITEVCQQIQEAHTMMHEQIGLILERTPKLPKRTPPPPQAETPPVQPVPTPTQAPAPSAPPVTQVIDPPGQPIRLSDHLQPLVRSGHGQGPIYMVQGDPLSGYSTQELLRALLARPN